MKRRPKFDLKDITTYAHQEIDRVRTVYKWLASILGIIIVSGASLIAIVSYNNINELKVEMRKETERITSNVNDRLDLIADRVKFDLEKEVFKVEQEVRERIRAEFDKENIANLVEIAANEKVSYYTDEIIKNRISKDLQPIINNLETELNEFSQEIELIDNSVKHNLVNTKKELETILSNTKKQLDSLQTISDFVLTVSSAQSGNRKDWDKLKLLGAKKDFIFTRMANDAHQRILDEYSNPLAANPFIDTLSINKNIDPTKITLDQSVEEYRQLNNHPIGVENYYLRLQFVKYIWERKDYKIKDRLEFLITVLKEDNHLYVVQYAGKLFSKHTELKIKYMAVDYFVDWWKKNKSKYD